MAITDSKSWGYSTLEMVSTGLSRALESRLWRVSLELGGWEVTYLTSPQPPMVNAFKKIGYVGIPTSRVLDRRLISLVSLSLTPSLLLLSHPRPCSLAHTHTLSHSCLLSLSLPLAPSLSSLTHSPLASSLSLSLPLSLTLLTSFTTAS
jgi:hypothetical protein